MRKEGEPPRLSHWNKSGSVDIFKERSAAGGRRGLSGAQEPSFLGGATQGLRFARSLARCSFFRR